MAMHESRVRINLSIGEIELAGSEDFIEKWYERLEGTLNTAASSKNKPAIAHGASPHAPVNERSFGEVVQGFPKEITDVDRILIAGLFVQEGDPDRVFSTRAANAILEEQGIKLSNPSMSVRRNMEARRVFAHGKGRFRVSQSGMDYLTELQTA